MRSVRNQAGVLAAVAAALGVGLLGGVIGGTPSVAQDASPVASPSGSPVASPVGTPDGAGAVPTTVTVESVDIDFIPEALTIPAKTDVTVSLPNNGRIPHNFSIDELDINETFQAGDAPQIVINAPAGTYEYYCNIPGHAPAGMVGTLTVE